MTDSHQDALILYSVDDDGVATLALNRPNKFNAFNAEMIRQWRAALEKVAEDRRVRVLVVTGRGEAFCAGGDVDDLEAFLAMDALEKKNYLWQNVHHIPQLLERIDCPVIAAINGTARGAGLDMALMCDLRIMDSAAVVAESYIRMALMPGDGGGWFLPRIVGVPKALELLWTGEEVDAQAALAMGLANRLAPAGQALQVALELARRIARQPCEAIRFTKRAVYDNMNGSMTLRSHLDAVSSHMALLEALPDFSDRVAAFRSRKS
ncbi:enoyl-CoA hydratase/isomerase family protein [Variovorax sp. VNK109]|uniref:enoyl-CoA hydratase/isomerase family protein n=1 Tax=Variovorax sp. VNK109 TaxID=3400919 RepID=UPI003C028F38